MAYSCCYFTSKGLQTENLLLDKFFTNKSYHLIQAGVQNFDHIFLVLEI